jgi:hypothetical protein
MIQWFIYWQMLQSPSAFTLHDVSPDWMLRQMILGDFPEPDAKTVWYAYPDGGRIKVSKSETEYESGRLTLCIEWYPPDSIRH